MLAYAEPKVFDKYSLSAFMYIEYVPEWGCVVTTVGLPVVLVHWLKSPLSNWSPNRKPLLGTSTNWLYVPFAAGRKVNVESA